MQYLIAKYNYPAPRYTSYPAVPFWNGDVSENTWLQSIEKNPEYKKGVDVYIHIPYCESLCFYCGCHRFITKNKSTGNDYVLALLKEWNLYSHKLSGVKINSLHLGGGTPTFLSPVAMKLLIGGLFPFFNDDFIGSVEIDPRTCLDEHLEIFQQYGLNRVSLGIQDFNYDVQNAVNRIQPFSLVKDLVKKLRRKKIKSLNFDLIYGLPLQTKQTIEDTIKKVTFLKPDLVAFYSYAHLPDKIKNQKLISQASLPTGAEKRELYEHGKKLLQQNEYFEIGLDHFARRDSYLYKVYQKKQIVRNFMGYTDKVSANLIGLGISSISNNEGFYAQNTKDISIYNEYLLKGQLPIVHGHQLTQEDSLIGRIIQEIMCNGRVPLSLLKKCKNWDIVYQKLSEMERDGLVTLESSGTKQLVVNDIGKPFLRPIVMAIDPYMQVNKTLFSQTL